MMFSQATPLYALLHHEDGSTPTPCLVIGWAADAAGRFCTPIYVDLGEDADAEGVIFRGDGYFSHVSPHEPSVDY